MPRISLLHFWDSWDILTQTLISYPPPPEDTDALIVDSETPDESIDDCE
jgi:hypothetical protein